MSQGIRREVFIYENVAVPVIRQRIRTMALQLLMNALPTSKLVTAGRPICPHIYQIGASDSYMATLTASLDQMTCPIPLTKVADFKFALENGKIIEYIGDQPFTPREMSVNTRMFKASKRTKHTLQEM